MLSVIYSSAEEAAAAIALVDAARHPDGTEPVRVAGEVVTRPAKTWAVPVELLDGRYAVTWHEALGPESSAEPIEAVLDESGEALGMRVRP